MGGGPEISWRVPPFRVEVNRGHLAPLMFDVLDGLLGQESASHAEHKAGFRTGLQFKRPEP